LPGRVGDLRQTRGLGMAIAEAGQATHRELPASHVTGMDASSEFSHAMYWRQDERNRSV
jgi:hypothetical protein